MYSDSSLRIASLRMTQQESIALLTHSNPIPNHEQKRTLEQNPEHRDYDTYRRSDLIRSDLVHRNVIYYLKPI